MTERSVENHEPKKRAHFPQRTVATRRRPKPMVEDQVSMGHRLPAAESAHKTLLYVVTDVKARAAIAVLLGCPRAPERAPME